MMMHKVFKVARVMGPSVVFIDECEKARNGNSGGLMRAYGRELHPFG